MKIYVVYESRFGELTIDCEPTAILGLFDSKEKAIDCALENCEDNKINSDYGYIYDEKIDIDKEKKEATPTFRMFKGEQKNWDNYFETIVEEYTIEINNNIIDLIDRDENSEHILIQFDNDLSSKKDIQEFIKELDWECYDELLEKLEKKYGNFTEVEPIKIFY